MCPSRVKNVRPSMTAGHRRARDFLVQRRKHVEQYPHSQFSDYRRSYSYYGRVREFHTGQNNGSAKEIRDAQPNNHGMKCPHGVLHDWSDSDQDIHLGKANHQQPDCHKSQSWLVGWVQQHERAVCPHETPITQRQRTRHLWWIGRSNLQSKVCKSQPFPLHCGS
jgi:hypothetical protein